MRATVINLAAAGPLTNYSIPQNAFWKLGCDVSYGISSGSFVYDDCTKWTYTDDSGTESIEFVQDDSNLPLGPVSIKPGGSLPKITCTSGALTLIIYGVNA